jgi:tetratricopeptide (TPR) repeat protein
MMCKFIIGLITFNALTYSGSTHSLVVYPIINNGLIIAARSDDISEKAISQVLNNLSDVQASKVVIANLRATNPEYLLFVLALYMYEARNNSTNVVIQFLVAYTYQEIYLWKYSLYPKKGLVPEALSVEANIYRNKFDIEIDKAIKMDPSLLDSYYSLLDMALSQGDDTKATWALEKILEAKPNDLRANLQMTELCFGQMAIDPWTAQPEYLNKTIHYSKIVLKLSPDNLDAMRILAGAYEMGGHYEKALPLYRQCIALDPNKQSGRAKTCRFWISKIEKDMKNKTRRPLIPLEEVESPSLK